MSWLCLGIFIEFIHSTFQIQIMVKIDLKKKSDLEIYLSNFFSGFRRNKNYSTVSSRLSYLL